MKLIPKDFFLDDSFDNFFTPGVFNDFKCDIYEKEGKYFIELDAPGFDKKDLDVEYNNGYLKVMISKEKATEDKTKNYVRRERKSQSYSRSFYVGEVDEKDIKATYENGLVKIEVPAVNKQASVKKITVE